MYREHFLQNNPLLKVYCKQFNLHREINQYTFIKWKTKGYTSPSRITLNNKTFTNKSDTVERFNKYYIRVGPHLASTIDPYDEEPTKYTSFITPPVEATQVCKLFQNLSENKTSLDIQNKFIKIASELLSRLYIQPIYV